MVQNNRNFGPLRRGQIKITLETAGRWDLIRLFPKMPLADHVGVVARLPQQLGQGGDILSQMAFIARHPDLVGGYPFAHVAQAILVRVHAGQEHRSRR
jgi:hypothetical protein